MTTDTKAVARWDFVMKSGWGGPNAVAQKIDSGAYVAFTDHEQVVADLRAELAMNQRVQVPSGWKLVPIEPNWDMQNEGREFLIEGIEHDPERAAYFLWKTMVAVAPEVE